MRKQIPMTSPAAPSGGGRERRHSRVPFHTVVSLVFPDKETYDHRETRDLGLRGVFVEGVKDRDEGETCRVELCLTGTSSRMCLTMEGTVIRRQEEGIAIRFTATDPDSFFHLRNIIYYNSEDADELQEYPFREIEES